MPQGIPTQHNNVKNRNVLTTMITYHSPGCAWNDVKEELIKKISLKEDICHF
jgi:hypothetical protein